MYREADKRLKKTQAFLKSEALNLENTGFDELHSMGGVTVVTKKLMKKLKKRNDDDFWAIAWLAYQDAVKIAVREGYKRRSKKLKRKWLTDFLDTYNPVTGYLYNPEAERKRLRLSEAINTALSYKNRKLYWDNIKRFFSLWFTQTKQYSIDTVDNAETQAWEDMDVEYAMWITALDERVCSECAPRHGKIYPLKEFPKKPHYNCRCRKKPMPKGWKPKKDTNSES